MPETIALDRRKSFRFGILIDGYLEAYAKAVQAPEGNINTVDHTVIDESGRAVIHQTAGRYNAGTITIEDWEPADKDSTFWEDWQNEALTQPAETYQKPVTIQVFGANGDVIKETLYPLCWPPTVAEPNRDKESDDNTFKTITLSSSGIPQRII